MNSNSKWSLLRLFAIIAKNFFSKFGFFRGMPVLEKPKKTHPHTNVNKPKFLVKRYKKKRNRAGK